MRGHAPEPNEKSVDLTYIHAARQTIQIEEFPEGPYGSATTEAKPGKVTPWEAGQQVATRFKDENPQFSRGTMPPPGEEPPGSQL
jgi:hypothetical protein